MDVYYKTLTPSETYPYLPGSVARAGDTDFRPAEGFVRFDEGQISARFNVLILDDVEPENDESVFVRLVRLQLVTPGQSRPGKVL